MNFRRIVPIAVGRRDDHRPEDCHKKYGHRKHGHEWMGRPNRHCRPIGR